MKLSAAVAKAKRREHNDNIATMVYYDDDYQTYRAITAANYYDSPAIFESDIVWSSDAGFYWSKRQIARHPG